jgi:hypothetical protein
MLAPTAGVWSYLAWIMACASALVSSGADLQPLSNNPAPKKPNVPKTSIFAAFFTFPPHDLPIIQIGSTSPFFSCFPMGVNGDECRIAHKLWILAPGGTKIVAG